MALIFKWNLTLINYRTGIWNAPRPSLCLIVMQTENDLPYLAHISQANQSVNLIFHNIQ